MLKKVAQKAMDGLARRVADELVRRGGEGAPAPRLSASEEARPSFQGMYVGRGVVLTTLHNGLPLYVPGGDISLAPHVIRAGRWEDWIARHWLGALSSGQRVVDVGANIGYYTLLAAEQVGPRGRVATFEPNPRVFDLLTASVAINGFRDRVDTYQLALSDSTTRLTFWAKDRETGGSGLRQPSEESLASLYDTADALEVDVRPLDEVLHDWPAVDVVKLDAEGAELGVLKGATALLDRSPGVALLMEFDSGMYEDDGAELVDLLSRQGFAAWTMGHDGSLRSADLTTLVKGGCREDLLLRRQR